MAKMAEALRRLQDIEDLALEHVLDDPSRPGEMVTLLADDPDVVGAVAAELELVAISLECQFTFITLPPLPDDSQHRVVVRVQGSSLHLLDYTRAARRIIVAYAH